MATYNPYAKYQSNSVFTASKEELTLMLYEGGLKFCNQAIKAIEDRDYKEAHRLIMRAEDIIEEFQVTLDRKYPIAAQFDALYGYMYRRLVDANVSKSIPILMEVRDLYRDFRDMWKEAMVLAKKQR